MIDFNHKAMYENSDRLNANNFRFTIRLTPFFLYYIQNRDMNLELNIMHGTEYEVFATR